MKLLELVKGKGATREHQESLRAAVREDAAMERVEANPRPRERLEAAR